ncbi:MAG: DUF5050 domain-containing protein [Lachnospiraceae bacterium]|nr:DUF5050 domain-containing protein [Lachnospiraceae bacterium]
MTKNKKQSILALSLAAGILIILALGISVSIINGRVKMNPDGTIGNTAGNLNNGGYFCEYNGRVYFANSFAGGALYSMNPDESDLKQLGDSSVRNILAGGEYLYYFRMGAAVDSDFGSVSVPRSFNRCDLNGENIATITRDTVITGQLVNNYLYLLVSGNSDPSFYKIKIDKSESELLADYTINPACAVGSYIYYNGTQNNHFLYSLNTENDVSDEILEANIWYPSVDGDYVYYLDVDNNYRICRYSMSQNVIEVLTEDRADCYNEAYGFIYYQTVGENPCLVCMMADGSGKTVIAEGVYTNINITSRYVYYQEYDDDSTLYHTLLGSSYGEVFSGAREAAGE